MTEGVFSDWGVFISSGMSVKTCLEKCLEDTQCLGADHYHGQGGACWHHNITSYCLNPVVNAAFTNYKKLPCLGKTKDAIGSLVRPIAPGSSTLYLRTPNVK